MKTPEKVKLEDVSCPVDECLEAEKVLTGSDLIHGLSGEFDVVKCSCCGLMRTSPRPTIDTIGYYYPDDYGPYLGTIIDSGGVKQNLWSKISRYLIRQLSYLVDFKTQSVPVISAGKMLEIGCASGSYLHSMSQKGWDVTGIEFSEKSAEMAVERGYKVHSGSLESVSMRDEKFDLIVGWMVLEHLHQPVDCLKKLREWAEEDAWLVISVPNVASFDFRLFKKNWYSLHLPNHLYHFTPSTIRKMLKIGGWKIVKIHNQRVLKDFLVSLGYKLSEKGFVFVGDKLISISKKSRTLQYLLYPIAWLLSLFGQTGRMTIWAKLDVKDTVLDSED